MERYLEAHRALTMILFLHECNNFRTQIEHRYVDENIKWGVLMLSVNNSSMPQRVDPDQEYVLQVFDVQNRHDEPWVEEGADGSLDGHVVLSRTGIVGFVRSWRRRIVTILWETPLVPEDFGSVSGRFAFGTCIRDAFDIVSLSVQLMKFSITPTLTRLKTLAKFRKVMETSKGCLWLSDRFLRAKPSELTPSYSVTCQDRAVETFISGEWQGCFVWQGPTGTGKSYTISELVRRLVEEGMRVLCVAHSNAAVDKLWNAITKHDSMGPRTHKVGQDKSCGWQVENPYEVIVTTTTKCRSLKPNSFAVLILYEAASCLEVDLLNAFLCLKLKSGRLLLVGDPSQVPPVIKDGKTDHKYASLMNRMAENNPQALVCFDTTYVQHPLNETNKPKQCW